MLNTVSTYLLVSQNSSINCFFSFFQLYYTIFHALSAYCLSTMITPKSQMFLITFLFCNFIYSVSTLQSLSIFDVSSCQRPLLYAVKCVFHFIHLHCTMIYGLLIYSLSSTIPPSSGMLLVVSLFNHSIYSFFISLPKAFNSILIYLKCQQPANSLSLSFSTLYLFL